MFKKIAITLILVGFANPVRALTPQEAESVGFANAMSNCKAIWDGARTLTDIIMTMQLSRYNSDISHYITRLAKAKGDNHPLVRAFDKGYDQGIEPCQKENRAIVKKGWNAK